MTQTTDSRQLRLLIDSMLSAYGIDNAELSFKLSGAIKKLLDSPTPVRTREEIMSSLQKKLTGGVAKQAELERIEKEIHLRTVINPVTRDWQEFIKWAAKKNEESHQDISKFLDWWLSDEWQKAHPPTKPESWYVKWDLAFVEVAAESNPYANARNVTQERLAAGG